MARDLQPLFFSRHKAECDASSGGFQPPKSFRRILVAEKARASDIVRALESIRAQFWQKEPMPRPPKGQPGLLAQVP